MTYWVVSGDDAYPFETKREAEDVAKDIEGIVMTDDQYQAHLDAGL